MHYNYRSHFTKFLKPEQNKESVLVQQERIFYRDF